MFLLINILHFISTTKTPQKYHDYKCKPIDYDSDSKESFMDTLIQDMKKVQKVKNVIEDAIKKIEKDIECKSMKLNDLKNYLEKEETTLDSSDLLKIKNEIEISEKEIKNLEDIIKYKRSEQKNLQRTSEAKINKKVNNYLCS